MKSLILGCGKRHQKQEGEILVDIHPFSGVDIAHDLNQLPWPFENEAFTQVIARHIIEHLDNLITFMDEAWRVLSPGGSLYIETPLAGADPDLEWSDPNHRRCYRIHTFVNYFSLEGIEQFGYTDRAWNFFHLAVKDNCIFVHAYPLKH